MGKPKQHIYMIAGEASGDFLGAKLFRALGKAYEGDIKLSGIGGERLIACGMLSLFPMYELSLMGFVEVIPRIFPLKMRIKKTVKDIIEKKPDLIITIDSPGFTFRVIKELRKRKVDIPTVHYVAPTVWAYKPERAKKTADLFDMLLALLPFEPPYFEKHGLQTHFIGHPIAWDWKETGNGPRFRELHFIPENRPLLGLLPGSRKNEIKRMLPVYHKTVKLLKKDYPQLELMIAVRPNMADHVRKKTSKWATPVHLVVGDGDKKNAFDACDVMIAKSGTVSLEVALAGVPLITVYKANPITAWIVKRMIKIPYVNLINIIAEKEIIPELLQGACRPKKIVKLITALMEDQASRDRQINECKQVFSALGQDDDVSPSDKAAEKLVAFIENQPASK